MEYGAPAYFPCSQGESDKLERVQRLGSRWVPGMNGLSFPERYRALHTFSLEYRRLRADLITMYRVMVRQDYPDLRTLVTPATNLQTRGHEFKLEILRTDNLPHAYRWSRRTPAIWNSLPGSIVQAPTIRSFKLRIDDHFSSIAYGDVPLRERPLRVPARSG